MPRILLIDDDPDEKIFISRYMKNIGCKDFTVDQAFKCSQGLAMLSNATYDLVLLDNVLGDSISAEFSVPFLKDHVDDTPIAIISNNISAPHLSSADILGVDFIIDKTKLSKFLELIVPALLAKRAA